jgi:hypothetical protein
MVPTVVASAAGTLIKHVHNNKNVKTAEIFLFIFSPPFFALITFLK